MLLAIAALLAVSGPVKAQPVGAEADPRLVEAAREGKRVLVLYSQRRFEAAEVSARKALGLAEAAAGKDHLAVVVHAYRLGTVLRSLGKRAEAREQLLRAAALHERLGGPESYDSASIWFQLAVLALSERRLADAADRFAGARARYAKVLGPGAPATIGALRQLALVRRRQKQPDQAQRQLLECLALATKHLGPRHREVAIVHNELGLLVAEVGRHGEAVVHFDATLAIFLSPAAKVKPLEVANVRVNRARSLLRKGDARGAATAYATVRDTYAKHMGPTHDAVGHYWGAVGLALSRIPDPAGAIEAYRASVQVYEAGRGKKHPSVAQALVNLATMQKMIGDLAGAEGSASRALAIQTAAFGKSDRRLSSTISLLSVVLIARGQFPLAARVLRRALAIDEVAHGADSADVADTLLNLALAEKKMGAHRLARRHYERSLQLLRKHRGPRDTSVAVVMDNLGTLLAELGDYDGARRLFEDALLIFERAHGKDHLDVATNLNNQASLLKILGDLQRALPIYHRALRIFEARLGPSHPKVAIALDNLGTLLAQLRRHKEALKHFDRALVIHRERAGKQSPRVATSLTNRGWSLVGLGRFDDAIAAQRAALKILKKRLGARHHRVGSVQQHLGVAYRHKGDHRRAGVFLARALETTRHALGPDHPLVAERLHSLALSSLAAGKLDVARRQITQSLDIVESTMVPLLSASSERERLRIVGNHRPKMELYLSLHDRPGDSRTAWARVLGWKAVVLSSLVTQRDRLLGGSAAARSKLDELSRVRSALASATLAIPPEGQAEALAVRRRALTETKEGLERDLARSSRAFATDRSLERSGPDDVCKALGDREAMVDFVRYQRVGQTGSRTPHYRAFVLAGGRCAIPVTVELGPAKAVEDPVVAFRRAVYDELDSADVIDEARRVRVKVWDPLRAALANRPFVWLVPDGALNAFPFGVMPQGARATARQTRFLVERYTFSYLTSAKDLLRLEHAQPRSGRRPLVVGGVDYERTGTVPAGPRKGRAADKGGAIAHHRGAGCGPSAKRSFAYLPATRTEALAVSAALGSKRDPIVLTGGDATERAVARAMRQASIIHLATHGFFAGACPGRSDATRNPLVLSGIVLSGASRSAAARREAVQRGEGDGILTAEEVAGLDLRGVDMAVLSACETGLGDIERGEGVLGLRWAFTVAGARALMMSLWKVPDSHTRALMEAFYGALAAGEKSKAAALRTAQVALLERLRAAGDPSPWAWAAFIASGR